MAKQEIVEWGKCKGLFSFQGDGKEKTTTSLKSRTLYIEGRGGYIQIGGMPISRKGSVLLRFSFSL